MSGPELNIKASNDLSSHISQSTTNVQLTQQETKVDSVSNTAIHQIKDSTETTLETAPQNQEMYTTVFQAKQKERKLVHTAIVLAGSEAKERIESANGKSLSEAVKQNSPFTDPQKIQQVQAHKINRILSRALCQMGEQKVDANHFQGIAELVVKGEIKLGSLGLDKTTMKQIEKVLNRAPSKSMQCSYEKMTCQIEKLDALLQEKISPGDLEKHNQKKIKAIREVLSNSAYQMLKEDESHPAIQYIHSVVLGMYTKPQVLGAFQDLGNMLKDDETENKVVNTTNQNLSKGIDSTRGKGEKGKLIIKQTSLKYISRFTKNFLGAFLSTSIAQKLGLKYDSRVHSENNAGVFFKEKLHIEDSSVDSHAIYTGSPTIGNRVSFEFHAALQALENRHFMSKEELEKDPYPITSWTYTNLQNITNSDEGPRSAAIMRLNEEYPFSFQGITITQDSSFYRDGIHGSSTEAIEKCIKEHNLGKETLEDSYKNKMFAELTDEANFTLANRTRSKGGGYYFPVRNEEAKQVLKGDFQKIIDSAFETVLEESAGKKPDDMSQEVWNWQQKAAFRELVHMGIMRYFDMQAAKKNSENNGGGMLHSKICKEGIDRGGKTMAAFYWALSNEDDEEKIKNTTLAALDSRPLLTRYRMILKDRVYPLQALINAVSRKGIKNFLQNIAQGVSSPGAEAVRGDSTEGTQQ